MATDAGTKHRIKIVVLIGALEVGGAERDIIRTFPRLNRDEFEVVVLEFNHAGPLGGHLPDAGLRVVSRRTAAEFESAPAGGRLAELRERIATLLWVTRVLRAERPDITHSVLPHSYVYQMVGGALARSRARRVMSRRSLNFYRDHQWLISWLERRVLHRRIDAAICNSAVIRDELVSEGVAPARIHVVYNGIDIAPFTRQEGDRERARMSLGIDLDALVFLAVGNLYAYKGHRDLIESCALARDRLPQRWELLVVGRDEEGNRDAYDRLIAERGLGGHVRMLGPRDDVALLLAAADIFVQPSHHEGLPNAVIEAMAASLPVVATAVGGIPELVAITPHSETGLLVQPEDVEALAQAMVTLAENPTLREEMGLRGRSRAELAFSVERSVRDYEGVYRGVLT